MKRFDTGSPLLVVAVLLAAGASTGVIHAEQAPQTATPPAVAAPQDAPPVIQFPATGITLEEAVRLTLQHDPNLKRSATDVMFAEGIAQQLRGAFDAVLAGTAEYTHRTQELSDSAKDDQQRQRDALQEQIDDDNIFLGEVETLRTILNQLRNAPPGGFVSEELSRINPTISTTIQILDQLIITTDPAQRAQLIAIRNQFITDTANQLEADINEGVRRADSNATRLRNLGPTPVDEVFIEASAAVRVDKLFRSGISVSPFIDGTFSGTNFKGKPKASEFGGKNASDQMQFRAGVNFVVPLLRGRGAAAVAAQERAALLDLDAARLGIDFQSANSVLAAVTAYWNLRAAQEAADIAAQSVKFQTDLLALTKQLITAQELPGIESARAQAAEARAQAQVQDAERRLHEARIALADVMGVSVTADPATLPRAADSFPEMPADPTAMVQLVEQAIGTRLDLSAAAKSTEAGEILLGGARRNLSSRFDVSLGTWYTAIDQGTGREALDRWVGPSGSISLDWEKPLGNNAQRGLLVQAEADLAQRQISRQDLERRIRLAVVEVAGSLQQAQASVQQAQAAVGFYQSTIDAEMQRLRAGDATLLDAVQTQQQQVDALRSLVEARAELARRLARLRFETGGLVTGGKYTPRDAPAAGRDRN